LAKGKGAYQGKRGNSEKDGGILFVGVKVDRRVVDEYKGIV
jgi:hypothetical protein